MTPNERAALLPILALAFIAGLLVADFLHLSIAVVTLLTLAAVLLVALSALSRVSILPALALAALLMGILRAGLVEPIGDDLASYHGDPATTVQGLVVDQPVDHGGAHSFRLSADRISIAGDGTWLDVSGDIRVTASPTVAVAKVRSSRPFRYGDRLEIRGRLKAPEPLEDFDYPAYLESQGIRTVSPFPEVVLISEGNGSRLVRWLSTVTPGVGRFGREDNSRTRGCIRQCNPAGDEGRTP